MGRELYFLDELKVELAVRRFRACDVSKPESALSIFEDIVPGNNPVAKEMPYERFSDYETLLKALQSDDPSRYRQLHKGTEFFFMSWLAYDMRNYEQAMYYMNAAVAEDKGNFGENWKSMPASDFFFLETPPTSVMARTIELTREALCRQINRFSSIPQILPITMGDVIDKFVKVIIDRKSSLITAFYTFLLEYEERYNELLLRSGHGGSMEPHLLHLFKGGLIFESLLKVVYPRTDSKPDSRTLKKLFDDEDLKKDFPVEVDTYANSLRKIIDDMGDDSSLQSAFNTTSKLRNASGHNLIWDDIFIDPANYQRLFEQEMNAIFYIISKKFIGLQGT
ncbi:MAG: hypothetical protein M0Z79_09470 [Nitrospiraceae bacterium]|nr:hypothetical protein [Nitrospiraceae bacterium]